MNTRKARKRREALLGYALVLPSLLLFGAFAFYPFIKDFWLGLYRSPPFPGLPRRWAGIGHYWDIIGTQDFWNSFKVTVLFALYTVPLGLGLGLLLAVLAHQRLRGIAVFRTIFSSTVATSIAVASVIFFTLLNPQVGLFTYWLGREGEQSVLSDPKWALVAVSVTTIWQNLGLSFIIMSAGLQTVPDELLEAARVDGAGTWSRFRNVMLPLLSPTLFFSAVVGTIVAFQAFGQIDLLTEGGPRDRTNVLAYSIYRAFRDNNEGEAAVLAIALFAITLVLTVIQLRFLERRVTYERWHAAAMLGRLDPSFTRFLIFVGLLLVTSVVLGVVGIVAKPKLAARVRKANRYILLCVLAMVVLFPIYITVVNSLLKPDKIIARPPTLFPTDPQWGAYRQAWTHGHLGSYLFNSAVVTVCIVAGQLVTSILAGYAFAFLEFPLKRTIFVVFLATMMIPFEVVFFTNLQTIDTLGGWPAVGRYLGLGTYGALVVPFLATGFGAFLIRQAFLALPRDLRDAAALDGYGHFRFMVRVAVPLARPTVAALALFSFFGAWNQYLWPLVAGEERRTVQVGLRQLRGEALDQINVTFAGAVLAALPLFVLLIVFQKQLVRGLTAGGVKG